MNNVPRRGYETPDKWLCLRLLHIAQNCIESAGTELMQNSRRL